MAKSMTVGKRENEKKRLAKREEKLKKKESKKFMHKYLNPPLQSSQPKCIQISGNLSKVIKKQQSV